MKENIITKLLDVLVEPISSYFKNRSVIKAEVKKRKDEIKKLSLKAKIKSIQKSEDINLSLDQSNGSDPIPWANDVTLVLFLLPFVLAFYPPALPHIIAGFEALENMPEWYKYSLAMMLISVWGYRNLVSPIIQSIAKAYLSRGKI